MAFDTIRFAQDLIRCPSVTPQDAGALDVLSEVLESLGFTCHHLTFKGDSGPETRNLFASYGQGAPHFCFAGHTDVVPAGDSSSWKHDPFEAVIEGGMLFGRGAVDMKGGIASFAGACHDFIKSASNFSGTISFMITGDEEGCAVNGTPKILKWLSARGVTIDFCLVGEPTSCQCLGDTIKIGRRGSLNGILTTKGAQGHVAFPEKSDNPIPRLLACAIDLNKGPKENKSSYFEPTNVELTSLDVGNMTENLIPEEATARFNIRFSDQQTSHTLKKWLRELCREKAGSHFLSLSVSGEAEMLSPGEYTDLLKKAIKKNLGQSAELSTKGATSDARFIRHYAPVLELGLVGTTMHQTNECVPIQDLLALKDLYEEILESYFQPDF